MVLSRILKHVPTFRSAFLDAGPFATDKHVKSEEKG
jgi:hypothetical protein